MPPSDMIADVIYSTSERLWFAVICGTPKDRAAIAVVEIETFVDTKTSTTQRFDYKIEGQALTGMATFAINMAAPILSESLDHYVRFLTKDSARIRIQQGRVCKRPDASVDPPKTTIEATLATGHGIYVRFVPKLPDLWRLNCLPV